MERKLCIATGTRQTLEFVIVRLLERSLVEHLEKVRFVDVDKDYPRGVSTIGEIREPRYTEFYPLSRRENYRPSDFERFYKKRELSIWT